MISYDIQEQGPRRKIQKTLEGFGQRVQFSVFECSLTDRRYSELKEKIVSFMKKETDSLRFYRLCEHCVKKIEIQGSGILMEDDPFFIV